MILLIKNYFHIARGGKKSVHLLTISHCDSDLSTFPTFEINTYEDWHHIAKAPHQLTMHYIDRCIKIVSQKSEFYKLKILLPLKHSHHKTR